MKLNFHSNSASNLRAQFPILARKIGTRPLAYFDNAATTQKPLAVLDAMDDYYRAHNANVHRGIHRLAEEATMAYESAHVKSAHFIGAKGMEEIIFTRGTTESFNLLARLLEPKIKKGDEILLTQLEHHSNLVPWQQLAARTQAKIKFIPLNPKTGELNISNLDELITSKTKLVSITFVSNVLGTIVSVKKIAKAAHAVGALVAVDAAQAVSHLPVDVKSLNCDFLAFSGHKMYGPTGIGVLYGRESLLRELEPVFFGGEMVREVTFERATWNSLPWKFEPGTPPIAEAVGLAAAVDFMRGVSIKKIQSHEHALVAQTMEGLSNQKGVTLYGPPASKRGSVVAFNGKNVHAHDMASLLNEDGIAIRAGNHCAMPLTQLLGLSASARASFAIYNTPEEVERLVSGVARAQKIFAPKKKGN